MSTTRIAGRLRAHAAAWRRYGASNETLRVVEYGYEIPFAEDRRGIPRYFAPRNGDGCRLYEAWLRSTLPELLAVGAIEEVPHAPHVVALVNVIPKSTAGKYRLIVDLRPLNKHVRERTFRYLTHATFRDVIQPNDDMLAFDFQSGYYHCDVAPADKTFLGFRLFGKFYVFAVLPFGLRDACYIFTELVKVPVRVLQSRGFRVLPYLDDILCLLQTMSQDDADEARALLEDFGFLLNLDKSVVTPTRRLENLGYVVDTTAMTYDVTTSRRAKMLDAARSLLDEHRRAGTTPARAVARVTGHVASAALVLGRRGRLQTRYLNNTVRDAAARRRWSERVPISDSALRELRLWLDAIPLLDPVPIRRPTRRPITVHLASDASDFAWGGRVLWTAPGVFPLASPLPRMRGTFTQDFQGTSSCLRELRAASRALDALIASGVTNEVVQHQVDSQSAFFVHRNGGSQHCDAQGDLDLHAEVLAMDESAAEAHLDHFLTWVPREENQEADDDSKLRDRGNYALSRQVFAALDLRFGPHTVDRFADGDNHLLRRFNARYWAPAAENVDAFSVSWSDDVNWLHPPLPVLTRVVGKLREDRARGTLIVPRWTGAPWWPVLFPRGPGPVLSQYTIPASRTSFVAGEDDAELGHGQSPPWTMLALRVDFDL